MSPRLLHLVLFALFLTPPAWGDETIHGVHTTTADLDRLKAWQEWTGKPARIVGENFWATSWEGLIGRNPQTGVGLTLHAWRKAFQDPDSGIDREKITLNLAVPMFPNSASEGGTDYWKIPGRWRDGAAGKFNHHFRKLAETLVSEGLGRSHLRLAWEFNVPSEWNRYAIRDEPENWPLFVEYWRQIHRSMMSVDGAEFQWMWCVSVGEDTEALVPTRDAWPGDDFVDIIGVDFYDGGDAYYWRNYQEPNPPFDLETIGEWLWEFIARGMERNPETGEIVRRDLPCLDSYYAFARKHGKDFARAEWGVVQGDRFPASWGNGGNDNPRFIENVHDWISEREVAYTLYFEYFIATDDYGFVDHSILPDYWSLPGTESKFIHPCAYAHPESSARYLKLFQGRDLPVPDPPTHPKPLVEDSFTRKLPAEWQTGGSWKWRRGALHLEQAPEESKAQRLVPALENCSLEFRIALPNSNQGVELTAGPYVIEFTRTRDGRLGRVRLLRTDSRDELATARPEQPHVIGKMYLPIRLEIRKLGSGMRTLSLHAGQEQLIHHLDIKPAADLDNTVELSASKGTTLYFDDFVVRPLPVE